MIIDIHAHINRPGNLPRGRAGGKTGGRRSPGATVTNCLTLTTSSSHLPRREFVEFEAILREQDKAGVDRVLLSPWSSLFRHDAHLAFLIDLVGIEQVMLGSDYPFDMGSEQPAAIVEELSIPRAQKNAILGGNAQRVLRM